MARKERSEEHGKHRLEKATYQPGDYGRMLRPDGSEQFSAGDMDRSPAPTGDAE